MRCQALSLMTEALENRRLRLTRITEPGGSRRAAHYGEIAKIVLAVQQRRPDLVELAFEGHAPRLLEILQAPLAVQLAFADSVSIGPKKVRLAEPWLGAFDLFGRLPDVRAEQLRRAR